MRSVASILHLDLDSFFASVEQRDKPSLRGKPVIVGGLGGRGVVATASYEARTFGVHSAMPMHEARRRCPQAAFLVGRFDAYRIASGTVMALLHELSPLVEPLSLDEAFVDLAAGVTTDFSAAGLLALAGQLRDRVRDQTGGLSASMGFGTSKMMAKVASELAKPDGVHLVEPGSEVGTLAPLSARALPGVGPASMDRLSRLGVRTVADLQRLSERELVRELGKAAGESLHALAWARDDRAVQGDREAKSVSMEDTFAADIADREQLNGIIERDAHLVAARLAKHQVFARTISIKVRWGDFTTVTRSRTLLGATDRAEAIARIARELLADVDVTPGVRLLGVGTSGFTTVAQETLFDLVDDGKPVIDETRSDEAAVAGMRRRPTAWLPGVDVVHDEYGPGWVWGAGLGRVTVRFETAESGPGPIRTFSATDEALHLGQA